MGCGICQTLERNVTELVQQLVCKDADSVQTAKQNNSKECNYYDDFEIKFIAPFVVELFVFLYFLVELV